MFPFCVFHRSNLVSKNFYKLTISRAFVLVRCLMHTNRCVAAKKNLENMSHGRITLWKNDAMEKYLRIFFATICFLISIMEKLLCGNFFS